MFQWSKKVVKSVTFNPEVADESLLSLVESHLEPQPEKTFSDLCKEALWQFLCVPESVKPGSNTVATDSVEQKIDELHRQVADLEERFFAKESNRLEAMERHIVQLTQQMAHLAILVTERPIIHHQPPTPTPAPAPAPVASSPIPAMEMANTSYVATPAEDVDPVISRLSQFLDDF
jgi:hypothetical protein